ncbi:hypothetical protein FXO37_06253 [Capsicum annuum]|nr:hypothetical protein FXO37_06253 [Capsicum annuum]
MEIIFTKFHHGEEFSNKGVPTYVASCVPELRYIDKDHFSILELLFYTKELGYETVRGFYYQDAVTKQFNLVKSDRHLLELVKDLKYEDFIDSYVYHILDEPILDPDGPTGFRLAPDIIECADLERESVGINDSANIEKESIGVEEESETYLKDFNLKDVEIENVNLEDINRLASELPDYLSNDSDLRDILSEDGSDIDKEGFGDIGKNKTTKYTGKLGEDKEYLDSSDYWSEDSEDIDVDVVRGVDLPRRRRSKKTRNSSDFIVKNYNPIHKCIPLNKNKMCDSNLVARKFKDKIISQLYIRIWEIQDFIRQFLSLYVGACKGELLVAVGKNGNNHMYPIAWAVVDTETKHSWDWFIRLWMLRGIPCPHAICAYYYLNEDPNQHVELCYNGMGSSNSSQSSTQRATSWNSPLPQSSFICGDTSAMLEIPILKVRKQEGQGTAGRDKCGSGSPGRGQCGAYRGGGSGRGQCGADKGVERGIGRVQGGSGRGLARKIANARGTPFESGRNAFSSQVPPLPTNKRPYNATSFATATGYKRTPTGFGVYSDPATGTQVYNPSTSSERFFYGGINLKSASLTNIDIGFKPSGLKWKGKDAITSTQLQQIKANKRKKVDAAKSSLSVGSSKK